VPSRLATASLALALTLPPAARADDVGLLEPMFVDGVMPPAANGLSVAVGAGRSTYTLPTVQLDVALGERAGASISFGVLVAPGQVERVALTAPVARFKVALLTPAEGRPGLVLGLNVLPSSREPSQSEAGLTLGLAWRAGPATLELVGGAETRAALASTEAVLGGSVGLEVAPRWRVIGEALGELGAERDVSVGGVVGFQVDARTLLLAGCLAGVTRDAEPYAVVVQLKRDL
jgi:hypothetical protein